MIQNLVLEILLVLIIVDIAAAKYLKTCVADGIVAYDYEPEALEILKSKKMELL